MEVLEWKKPTVTLFRERLDKPEKDPFAVIKAQRITLEDMQDKGFNGALVDFFTLMGDIDYISSPEGKRDRYILCWFDDSIYDFNKAFKKISGVKFYSELSYSELEGKRTYNATFQAKYGKI